jgi:hypothetical protein
MEAKLNILSIDEFMHLTRDELCDLSQRIEQALAHLEPGSLARTNALASIVNIRRAMLAHGWVF